MALRAGKHGVVPLGSNEEVHLPDTDSSTCRSCILEWVSHKCSTFTPTWDTGPVVSTQHKYKLNKRWSDHAAKQDARGPHSDWPGTQCPWSAYSMTMYTDSWQGDYTAKEHHQRKACADTQRRVKGRTTDLKHRAHGQRTVQPQAQWSVIRPKYTAKQGIRRAQQSNTIDLKHRTHGQRIAWPCIQTHRKGITQQKSVTQEKLAQIRREGLRARWLTWNIGPMVSTQHDLHLNEACDIKCIYTKFRWLPRQQQCTKNNASRTIHQGQCIMRQEASLLTWDTWPVISAQHKHKLNKGLPWHIANQINLGAVQKLTRARFTATLTWNAGAMISAQHQHKLNEACGVFGQLPLEPQQRNDIPHIVVACNECGHGDLVVSRLLTPVITDRWYNSGWYPHLCRHKGRMLTHITYAWDECWHAYCKWALHRCHHRLMTQWWVVLAPVQTSLLLQRLGSSRQQTDMMAQAWDD